MLLRADHQYQLSLQPSVAGVTTRLHPSSGWVFNSALSMLPKQMLFLCDIQITQDSTLVDFVLPRCSLGNQLHPFTSCMLPGQSLAGPQFFPGCRVLARREMDGLYYLATVIQQVQVENTVVSSGVVSSKCQLVCSLDMVNDSRAQSHCLVPGDVVLSPWEPNLKRFGPGRVIALNSKQQRPPWKYWRRTGPEPQHRQPGEKQIQTQLVHCSVKPPVIK
uniref:DUF4537 domain-containing protein n=1 Tax=Stegastes partitus TaxID=144197 RepID=A0A3B4YTM0_9TELE